MGLSYKIKRQAIIILIPFELYNKQSEFMKRVQTILNKNKNFYKISVPVLSRGHFQKMGKGYVCSYNLQKLRVNIAG